MSATISPASRVNRLFAIVSVLACAALGVIAIYSSGLGLLDPKMHRAGGFALALIVGVALSRRKRNNSIPD